MCFFFHQYTLRCFLRLRLHPEHQTSLKLPKKKNISDTYFIIEIIRRPWRITFFSNESYHYKKISYLQPLHLSFSIQCFSWLDDRYDSIQKKKSQANLKLPHSGVKGSYMLHAIFVMANDIGTGL